MASHTTQFPARPSKQSELEQQIWTLWFNIQYLANQVFDVFANKWEQGQAIITNPATTVAVAHTLGTSTFQVSVVPSSGDPGGRWWVSGKTNAQFVINLPAAPVGSVTFDWIAKAV